MSPIPEPITKFAAQAASQTANKSIASFSELVSLKFFGKSIAKLRARADIEYDKEIARWEKIEKPFWLQAESAKMDRQYINLGNTLLKTTPLIVKERLVTSDNDLFWGLLEHSKEISNEEMQSLISKIIAGEYNNPGSCSMSTLQVLKSLGKREIEEFEKFGSLLVDKKFFYREFFNFNEPQVTIRKNCKFNYGVFIELQNLGLIQANDAQYREDLKTDLHLTIRYFNENLNFKIKIERLNHSMPSTYELTRAGFEIMTYLNPQKSSEFLDWLKQFPDQTLFELIP